MTCKIHPTAIVEDGAELGSGVEVGAYSIIGPKVVLADGCKVHSHVVIQGNTSIGVDNEIFPFASIGTAPQDLKFSGEDSYLEIGARNKIRESVTLQPGTEHGGYKTIVGSDNLFMANSHVGHDCRVGSHNVFANSVALAGHVALADHVIVGGMAGIHQFCRVGRLAFIGAGAMVSLDVPPFCMVQGDRAHVRGLNLIGLKRAGVDTGQLSVIKKVYKHLILQSGKMEDKLSSLPTDLSDQEMAQEFVSFIAGSARGVIAPSKHRVDSESGE